MSLVDKVICIYFGQHYSENDLDDAFIELLKKADIFVFESKQNFNSNIEKCFGPKIAKEIKIYFQNSFGIKLLGLLVQYNTQMVYFENIQNPEEIKDSEHQYNKLSLMMTDGEPKEKVVPFFKTFMDYSMKTVFKKRDDYFLKQLQNLAKEHPDKKILVHRGIAHLPFFRSCDDKNIRITISTAPETFSENNKFDIEHYKKELGHKHKTYSDDEYYEFAKNRLIHFF